MVTRCISLVNWLARLWLLAAASIVTLLAFGSAAPAAHAAPLQPMACTGTAVTTGALVAGGWIGGNMNVTFSGQSSGCSYSGVIHADGTVALPSTMVPDTYTLKGSGTVDSGAPGSCVVWSLTCDIAPSSTFTLDGTTGAETIDGSVYCQGYVTFHGAGTALITLTGSTSSTFSGTGTGAPPTATPELSSSELLTTGLVPTLGILWYRRRQRRADAQER